MLCRSCGRENPSDAIFCNACASKLSPPQAVVTVPPETIPLPHGVVEPESQLEHAVKSVGLLRSVFVGRQRVMGELTAALEDALSSQGRVAMLAGEPGIGKTRTSQELTRYAGQRGAQVLWARCHSEQGAPPYWPWV